MDKEILILLITLGFNLITVAGTVVSNILIAKISNSDKAKKDITDFELSFKSLDDIDNMLKTGEFALYNAPSKKRIELRYNSLKEEARKAAEEIERANEESMVTYLAAGPKTIIKGMPTNDTIEIDDNKDK